jgi:serine/threonine protein kinase
VLVALARAGINVPRVYGSFRAEKNYYLSVEFIEGESFDRWLFRRQRRVSVAAALRRGAELARLVAGVHAAGWVWRDCKPGNVIVTGRGELRLLDFEGACPVARPDPLPWGTHPYSPPESTNAFRGQSRLPEDLYALGATIYFLLAGRQRDESAPVPLERLRRNVPARAHRILARLLDPDPRRRPDASAAARVLEAAAESLESSTERAQGVRLTRRTRSMNRGSVRMSS